MRQILEVGTGSVPYFVRYEIPWILGDAYLSIDLDEARMDDAKLEILNLSKSGKTYPVQNEFLVGDGTDLPLVDGSCDEVVLSNVISAPIHNSWNEEGTDMNIKNKGGEYKRGLKIKKGKGDMFYGERMPIIKEALRVLRTGGTLSIYTDLLIYGGHSYQKIIGELVEDMSLVYTNDTMEARRIDMLNERKLVSNQFCFCFDADVLPESHVLRFTKIY